jgi:anti-sigma factor RsiW
MQWHLIHNYLSGQCSGAEQSEVEQWMGEDPAHRAFLNSLQQI